MKALELALASGISPTRNHSLGRPSLVAQVNGRVGQVYTVVNGSGSGGDTQRMRFPHSGHTSLDWLQAGL